MMGQRTKINNKVLRVLITAAGFCFTGLGVLGIFLPVLPTVPLLLLAAACFARSSDRFYNWLTEHSQLGPMIKNYLNGQGIPLRAKCVAIAMIWLVIPVSVVLCNDFLFVQIILIIVGISVTFYLMRLPVLERVEK
jgi:uncharacterized membrane protein YbaN (DUF454 family)